MIEREPPERYGYYNTVPCDRVDQTDMAINLQMALPGATTGRHAQCGCLHFKFPLHRKEYIQKICWCLRVCVCVWKMASKCQAFQKNAK